MVVDRPKLKGYKKFVEGSPLIMVRCDVQLPGITANECFQTIYDFELRKVWDKALPRLDVVEKIDQTTDVIYSMFKSPWGVDNRDFCQSRKYGTNVAGLDYAIYMVSIDHPDCPPIKGNVRAHTYISGYTVKKDPADPENSCSMMIVSQVDIKGLVPKFIVNSLAAKGPADWAAGLETAVPMLRKKGKFKPEEAYLLPSIVDKKDNASQQGKRKSFVFPS